MLFTEEQLPSTITRPKKQQRPHVLTLLKKHKGSAIYPVLRADPKSQRYYQLRTQDATQVIASNIPHKTITNLYTQRRLSRLACNGRVRYVLYNPELSSEPVLASEQLLALDYAPIKKK